MRSRLLFALGVIASAAITAGGCHLGDSGDSSADRLSVRHPLAPTLETSAAPDSNPGPNPPPHPTPQPRLSVGFVSSDSVTAGQISITRWRFANGGHSTLAVSWTLTDEQGWPGLPKLGTVSLAPLSTQLLEVPVAVPDSTQPGFYALHMAATSGNRLSATADGGIPVLGGGEPPDTTGTARR